MDKYRERQLATLVADILNHHEDREKALEALRTVGLEDAEMEKTNSGVLLNS